MPILLQQGDTRALQSLMPRTGGFRLRQSLRLSGVETQSIDHYSPHDGVLEIDGTGLESLPVVATFRPSKVDWRRSMKSHLAQTVSPCGECISDFIQRKGPHSAREWPALGQWDPKPKYLRSVRHHSGSWFEQWTRYFIEPADVVIPFSSLPPRDLNVDLQTLLNIGWDYA